MYYINEHVFDNEHNFTKLLFICQMLLTIVEN